MNKIREYLLDNGESKTYDIANHLDLSSARTRVIIASMADVEYLGGNSNRRFILKNTER